MKKCSEKFATVGGEIGIGAAAAEFREYIRERARDLIIGVMAEEVESLCGPLHQPKVDGEFYRSGSAPGYILHEGRRHDVKRPRVRKRIDSGSSETVLQTYAEAQDAGELRRRLLLALQAGVSGREQSSVQDTGAPGTSKSEVSRLWAKEGEKILGEFRERDIDRSDWLALMLDGVGLEKDLLAVVALGVTLGGEKVLLDFEFGATENSDTAKSLLQRLARRGFRPAENCRLLSVLDGADALKTAVSAYFPDTEFQRCLVHKERNIRRHLRHADYPELSRLFDRLRKAEGEQAGREALSELDGFLSSRNAVALASLREAGEELICLHRLNVPSTLNVSFLSTNLIENPFRNVRRKLGRVCRWRKETNQASRWLAMALTEAEKGFRRLRNYKDLAKLHEALCLHRE